MTDKARELLRRILVHLEWTDEAGANEPLEEEIRAYLAQPEGKPFVRLSEEEMKACEPQLGIVKTPDGAKVDGLWIYDFARAIEDALEEKNK